MSTTSRTKLYESISAWQQDALALVGGLLSIDTDGAITQNNAEEWLRSRMLVVAMLRRKLRKSAKDLNNKIVEKLMTDAQHELDSAIPEDPGNWLKRTQDEIDKARKEIETALDTAVSQTVSQYRSAISNTALWVMTGAWAFLEAIRKEAADLADRGVVGRIVKTEKGTRRDPLDYTVETVVENTVIRTKNEIILDSIDTDFVEVSAHYGARPSHAEWQGKVYKINGSLPGYPNLMEATGYGTGPGLGGWNCRHVMWPFNPLTDTQRSIVVDPQLNSMVYQIKQKMNYHNRRIALFNNRIVVAGAQRDEDMVARYTRLRKEHVDRLAALDRALQQLGVPLQ